MEQETQQFLRKSSLGLRLAKTNKYRAVADELLSTKTTKSNRVRGKREKDAMALNTPPVKTVVEEELQQAQSMPLFDDPDYEEHIRACIRMDDDNGDAAVDEIPCSQPEASRRSLVGSVVAVPETQQESITPPLIARVSPRVTEKETIDDWLLELNDEDLLAGDCEDAQRVEVADETQDVWLRKPDKTDKRFAGRKRSLNQKQFVETLVFGRPKRVKKDAKTIPKNPLKVSDATRERLKNAFAKQSTFIKDRARVKTETSSKTVEKLVKSDEFEDVVEIVTTTVTRVIHVKKFKDVICIDD
jgi:hypothetical protein